MKHTFSLYFFLFLSVAVIYFSVSGHDFMTVWQDSEDKFDEKSLPADTGIQ